MTAFEIILVSIVVLLIILPPRFDPAVRLKEWLEARKK